MCRNVEKRTVTTVAVGLSQETGHGRHHTVVEFCSDTTVRGTEKKHEVSVLSGTRI